MPQILERLDALPRPQRAAALRMLRSRGEEFNVFPLSFAQRQLWFLHALRPASPMYNVPFAFWLDGDLDVAALERALHALVRRHESLRTAYFEIDGDPFQLIVPADPAPPPLVVRQWRASDAERPELVRRILDVEARQPFNLQSGRLIRARVFSAGSRHLLMLTLHHIACDGVSLVILFQELERLYGARAGRDPGLPPPPLRYVDFARWQVAQAGHSAWNRQLAYWVDHLAGAPEVLDFPRGLARSAESEPAGGAVLLLWSPDLAAEVLRFTRQEAVTPFMTMLAAYATLLHRRSGEHDIVLGTPFANRTRAGLEQVVGYFVNTLPLRLRPHGRQTFRELLHQVRDVARRAHAAQELPFELLVEALRPPRRAGVSPVFQLLFTVAEGEFELLRLPDLDVTLTQGHTGTTKVDLTASFVVSEDTFKASMEYDARRFDESTILGLLADLETILAAAVAQPDRDIADLPLAADSARPPAVVLHRAARTTPGS
jgi:hypothetical protein